MKLVMKLSLCLTLMCNIVGSTILIVGSKFIQPKRDYTIAISNMLDETSNDCLLNIHLEGFDYYRKSSLFNLTQTVTVMANTNKIVTFTIPSNIDPEHYNIITQGKQPSNSSIFNIYNHKTVLNFSKLGNNKNVFFQGFIQLNKPVITPGEMLKFRVIVLNSDPKQTIPHGTTVSVYIFDPNLNAMREWSNVSLYRGIFENEIAIPAIPVLGTYRVVATVNGNSLVSKTFEVKNYDIDSIDLNIYPTVEPLREHEGLNLTIDVKNYFGKPVRGTFTIISVSQYYEENLTTKAHTWDVTGKRQIFIPLKNALKTIFGSDYAFLNVTFTEQYTNRTISKKEKITIYPYKYRVMIVNEKLTYHQGSLFTARLKVTYWNNEPAKNVTLLVAVKGVNETYQQNCTSNRKGEITFSMPTNNSTLLSYIKLYDGDRLIRKLWIENHDSARLLADKYIKVELLTRVKFNRMFRLLVTCSDNMTILLYYVISQGNIVEFGSFRPNQTRRYSFQLLMSDKLIPRSKIFVATIVHKSFIASNVDLSINDFGNPVNIQSRRKLEIKIEENISEDGVDPGDEIELGIRGRPGAFVALAAYDQRLLQHEKNHDIFFDDVWEIYSCYPLRQYEIVFYSPMRLIGIYAVVIDDTTSVLDHFERNSRAIYPDAPRYGMSGPYRTDFSESWLWQNLTIPPSGRAELVVTVPHAITSWFITGISIDPKYGLGVVKKPATFSTVKIFFILEHLPHSIKRGETIALHFTLFSLMQEEFEATVTLFNTKNHFQFIDRPAEDAYETKSVFVPPNSDVPVLFLVEARKLGELEIRVNATIMQGVISDSFKKIIIVLPEDVMILRSKRIQFDRDTPLNQSFDIPLLIDNTAEEEDMQVDLTVYPDQQSLKDLQNHYNVSLHHDRFEKLMHVNSDFHENITIKSISGNVWKLSVIVKSSGSGMIQINWQYRLKWMHIKPRFILQMTKLSTPTKWMKELHICCSFIPEDKDDHSNGTIIEVSIPIGYAMENYTVIEETTINPIGRIEIIHDGTTLLVHYDQIGNETTCFSVFAYRRYINRVRHPSYIKVQDVYRPELNAVKMFDFH